MFLAIRSYDKALALRLLLPPGGYRLQRLLQIFAAFSVVDWAIFASGLASVWLRMVELGEFTPLLMACEFRCFAARDPIASILKQPTC